MNKRGLIDIIFGKKKEPENATKFRLIANGNSTNYLWDGNLVNSDIIRSAIRPKVKAISKLNAKHILGVGPTKKINPRRSIKKILQRPNIYMSMQDFLVKVTWQRELYNNAYIYVSRNDFGDVKALYPIRATSTDLYEVNGDIYIKFSFYNKKITIAYEEMIHLRKDFINNDFYGEDGMTPINNTMQVINSIDKGIIKAIKNSNIIMWLLKINGTLRPEDKEKEVKDFVKNYMSIDSEFGGAAAVDQKVDAKQVKPESYVPNFKQMEASVKRIYSYYGANEAIVMNTYNENQWQAYYEQEIEPVIVQLSNEFTEVFFTEKEKGFGNKIVFETSNLQFASMETKLKLVQFVDRGMMTPNEVREILNMTPIEGGDKPVRRLDTAEVEINKSEDEKSKGSEDDEQKS